jgi:hypothetical protein
MLEFNAGIGCCELPIGFGVVFVAVFSQAAISLVKVFLSGMRRSRHWDSGTPSSDSAVL